MASKGMGCLAEAMGALRISKSSGVAKTFARSMATVSPGTTETSTVTTTSPNITRSASNPQEIIQSWNPIRTVPLSIHSFPSLEPTSLEQWSVQHLYLPLRRDLLHAAVVYEGDATRQGTASTKTRWEVHGSHRKMRPQKGSGRARLGSRQSPMLRGGGKAFGPKPRDFATRLNRKVYDKAWRTALSYRYRQGELVICEDGMEVDLPDEFASLQGGLLDGGLREAYLKKYVRGVLSAVRLGRADGRTLFVTADRRDVLFEAMEHLPEDGAAVDIDDVDVKDLLGMGKLVMERSVLKELIERHQSDLVSRIFVNGVPNLGPAIGEKVL